MTTRKQIIDSLQSRSEVHTNLSELATLELAALALGLNDSQARMLTLIALEGTRGDASYTVPRAKGFERYSRERHAAEHPNGKWARLIARYGKAALHMDGSSQRALEWSMPHEAGTKARYLELAAEAPQATL